MKKIISILFTSLFLMSTAYAGGMIGIKAGMGDLKGNRTIDADYGTASKTVDSEYAAAFAEVNLAETPVSLGIEIVPLSANIGFDGNSADANAEVSDLTTVYLLASKEVEFGSVYGKLGYARADVTVTSDRTSVTITKAPDEIDGPMVGIGAQFSLPTPIFNTMRLEATHTMFGEQSMTSTSTGGVDSDDRSGDAELTTFSVSLARSF